MTEPSALLAGFTGSLLAGLMTGVGALPVLGLRLDAVRMNFVLALAAGTMLAAAFLSLLLPGIAAAEAQGFGRLAAFLLVAGAGLVGAAGLRVAGDRLARLGGTLTRDDPRLRERRIWLFVAAIALHNVPEGMAVGVSFADGGAANTGVMTAIGVGLQNMPEGLAIAGALVSIGIARGWAFAAALGAGLIEAVTGLGGALLASVAEPMLPLLLGLCAGAMIQIVLFEIIPDLRRTMPAPHSAAALASGAGVLVLVNGMLGPMS